MLFHRFKFYFAISVIRKYININNAPLVFIGGTPKEVFSPSDSNEIPKPPKIAIYHANILASDRNGHNVSHNPRSPLPVTSLPEIPLLKFRNDGHIAELPQVSQRSLYAAGNPTASDLHRKRGGDDARKANFIRQILNDMKVSGYISQDIHETLKLYGVASRPCGLSPGRSLTPSSISFTAQPSSSSSKTAASRCHTVRLLPSYSTNTLEVQGDFK